MARQQHAPDSPADPADLRADIARDGRKLYQIAAAADIAPNYLGGMLRGRHRLPADVAERVRRVLRQPS